MIGLAGPGGEGPISVLDVESFDAKFPGRTRSTPEDHVQVAVVVKVRPRGMLVVCDFGTDRFRGRLGEYSMAVVVVELGYIRWISAQENQVKGTVVVVVDSTNVLDVDIICQRGIGCCREAREGCCRA